MIMKSARAGLIAAALVGLYGCDSDSTPGGGGGPGGGGQGGGGGPVTTTGGGEGGTGGQGGGGGEGGDPTEACNLAIPAQVDNQGDTTGGSSVLKGSCVGAGEASEDVYTYTAPTDGILTITLDSQTDQGVYVRTSCTDAASELGCRDDQAGGAPETLVIPVTGGEVLWIFVDGYHDAKEAGPYTLHLDLQLLQAEVCTDLVDNDFDGDGDCDDSDCAAECQVALDAACLAATPALMSNSGDTMNGAAVTRGYCAGGGGSLESVYSYTPPADGEVTIALHTASDQSLHVRTECGDPTTEIGCADSFGVDGPPETLRLTVTGGQPFAIFIDGFNKPADAGPFTLDVFFQPSVCGDDIVSPFEQCDDGNTTQTDGCDNDCHIVPQDEVEPNDAAGAATPASEGVISGTIDVMANVDWYAVTVPGPASSLSVNIGDGATSTCGPSGEIESEIEVYDSAMVSIGYNDDISSNITGNFCSALYLTDLADGTYYVRVAASQEYCDDCLFDYSLTVSVE